MGIKMFGLLSRKPKVDEEAINSIPQPPGPDKPATRYRSFVERYLLSRVEFWPRTADPRKMAWLTISEATTIFNMIRRADDTYGKE